MGRAFHQTSTRFDYYRSPKKEAQSPHPAPGNYQIKGFFGDNPLTRNNRQYSFGTSRERMNKIHIDDINKSGKKLPGPGKYEAKPLIGQSVTYSMG